MLTSRILSERLDRPVHLKAEHLQRTGSFKVRGALNFMKTLAPETAARGVVTVSAGNHAQAVAWAAAKVGVTAKVVMPAGASCTKVQASADYGAEVIVQGSVFEAFQLALDLAEDHGLTFVHPFDDVRVLAGQGTVGLEILDDIPDASTVVVPVGGGGLCAGIATALACLDSRARVFGVEPQGAAAMRRSLDEGAAVRLESVNTVADGLGAPMAGDLTYPLIREHAEDVVLVSDQEIARALAFTLTYTKQLVEAGGAAGVAALLEGRIPMGKGPVVVVLSGGNVGLAQLQELLRMAEESGIDPSGAAEP